MLILRDLGLLSCLTASVTVISLKLVAFPTVGFAFTDVGGAHPV
jgi:hypothetical protein